MRKIIWERIWTVITKTMITKNVYEKCQVNFLSFHVVARLGFHHGDQSWNDDPKIGGVTTTL